MNFDFVPNSEASVVKQTMHAEIMAVEIGSNEGCGDWQQCELWGLVAMRAVEIGSNESCGDWYKLNTQSQLAAEPLNEFTRFPIIGIILTGITHCQITKTKPLFYFHCHANQTEGNIQYIPSRGIFNLSGIINLKGILNLKGMFIPR